MELCVWGDKFSPWPCGSTLNTRLKPVFWNVQEGDMETVTFTNIYPVPGSLVSNSRRGGWMNGRPVSESLHFASLKKKNRNKTFHLSNHVKQ